MRRKKVVRYTKDELASELKRYYKEFGELPKQNKLEKLDGYPTRKSFTNHFDSFNDALRYAGFNIVDNPKITKEYLLNELYRYIDIYNQIPTTKIFDEKGNGFPSAHTYRRVFGSWNDALKEAGFEVKPTQYTDEELKIYFLKFVEENNRIPSIKDFNCSEYPSFWCYQNRYGAWNKAVEFYGFTANNPKSGTINYFDNGERCTSTYEFDVSNWLRNHDISYLRNVPYSDFIDWYDGKRDCDYLIMHNLELIFVEIAGLYSFKDNPSGLEKSYIKRFNYKKEILLPELNHLILYPDDFREKTLDEMFSFLFEIENPDWNIYQEIYQGIAEGI